MNALRQILLSIVSLVLLVLAPIGAAWAQQVKVTAATPSSTYQGTVSLDVVVAGSGFDSSSRADFFVSGSTNPGGITVRKTVFHNSKEIVATIEVADTAVVANFDIAVTLSDGRKGKGTTLFAVQVKNADPCVGTQSQGFPSLVFGRQMSVSGVNAWYFVVADASGKCERTVGTAGSGTHDVNFRYDPSTGHGILLNSASGNTLVAATLSVTFDGQGIPSTQASAFSTILSKTDVPALPDLQTAGWTLSGIAGPHVSPDGSAIVFLGQYDNPSLGSLNVYWVCSLTAGAAVINPASCRDVHRAIPDSGSSLAEWGARGDSLYFAANAGSGSGTAIYRLRLSDGSFNQVWSLGTLFTGATATLDPALHERVAVYEGGGYTGCSKIWVIDADSCSGNSCNVLNGQGNPARSLTWLPDGRIAGEGQTAPNRKGQCSASRSIVTIDSNDTTGTSITLVTEGSHPDGSGGG